MGPGDGGVLFLLLPMTWKRALTARERGRMENPDAVGSSVARVERARDTAWVACTGGEVLRGVRGHRWPLSIETLGHPPNRAKVDGERPCVARQPRVVAHRMQPRVAPATGAVWGLRGWPRGTPGRRRHGKGFRKEGEPEMERPFSAEYLANVRCSRDPVE